MTAHRVVFDCNVFVQALGRPRGPSGRCLQLAFEGKLVLYVSPMVLRELREVTSRPSVIRKLQLIPERVNELFDAIRRFATLIPGVPPVFLYERDPDDSEYVNLAIAANAHLIVSRDRDLLELMNYNNPQSSELRLLAPRLRVLDPVSYLREYDAATGQQAT